MLKRRIKKWLPLFIAGMAAINGQAQQSFQEDFVHSIYTEKGTPANVVITNTTAINSDALDFSPAFYRNGIVFTSSRKKNGPQDEKIKETFFELFFSELDGSGIPMEVEDFSIEMNSQKHDGPVTFSRDGNTIYFTRNSTKNKSKRKRGKNNRINMKIYEAKRGHFDWQNVTELPFNSDDYTVMHPSLSHDGKLLYFASNMPGGYGGMDLYVVSKDGDIWGEPVNLGEKVNSDQNDAFPFIHENGDLFFASRGHDGLGGYDLYKAKQEMGTWGKATNLGQPLNSDKDDLGLIMSPNAKTGYFTSSRAGGRGKDDIYKFELKEGEITAPVANLDAKVVVYNADTKERVSNADVRIFERTADGLMAGGDLYDVVILPNRDNANELVMKLVAKDASTIGTPDRTTNKNGETPYSMRPNKQYVLFISKDGYLTNEVIYSTEGKAGEVTVEVALEEKRCATVKGRITAAKSGELLSNAIVTVMNTCNNEEQVLKSDKEGFFEACMPSGCNYTVTAQKSGYADASNKILIPNGNIEDVATILRMNAVKKATPAPAPTPAAPPTKFLERGSVIVLEKIYYDFNKSAIRAGAARDLDALANTMKRYQSMEIELISHTDTRGNAEYNQTLSERRAMSAKKYLIAKGISSNRIKSRGMGENTPRNHCENGVDCTEEQHQYNRRTEVKILSISESVEIEYGDNAPEVIDTKN